MKRFYTAFTGLLLVALLTGCSAGYRLKERSAAAGSEWPCYRGNLAATGARPAARFNGRLTEVWHQGLSGKSSAPLTIVGESVACPSTKKQVRFFKLEDGDYQGRLKTGGIPQTAVVSQNLTAFVGISPRRNRVIAIDLNRGKETWRHPIKDAAFAPIIISDRLIVGSTDGKVYALSLTDGSTLWTYRTDGRCVAGPAYLGGRVYQPTDQGTIDVLSADSGRHLADVELDAALVNAVAVDELLYAIDVNGGVYGINPISAQIVWKALVGAETWTAPAVANGRVYVGHGGGELVAFESGTGRELWSQEIGEVIKASPVVIGRVVVVGTMGGQVLTFDAESGQPIDRVQLEGAVEYPPVTDGERVIVSTQAGKIVCFGTSNEQQRAAGNRDTAEDRSLSASP